MNNKITTKKNVKDNLINIMRIDNIDYISLTDLARYKNPDNPGDVVIKWMSNKSSFDFYSLWEELFNENFKLAESREFKNDSANNSFTMSPSRWINTTNEPKMIKSESYIFKIKKDNVEYLYSVSGKYYQNHKQIKNIKQKDNIINVTNNNLQNFYINKENDNYYTSYYITIPEDKKKYTFDNIDVYNINANFYIWNYSQFININTKTKKKIKLFDNDIYNIDLCTNFKDYLLIADYNSKYKFNKFYLINTKNNKVKEAQLDKEVYFNSYFLGTYKKYIYLYDMQTKIEYKINPLKNTIYKNRYEILSNNKFEKITNICYNI